MSDANKMATIFSKLGLGLVALLAIICIMLSTSSTVNGDEEPELLRRDSRAVRIRNKKSTKFQFEQNSYEVSVSATTEVGATILATSASFKRAKSGRGKVLNYRLKNSKMRKATSDVFPFKVTKNTGEIILRAPIGNTTDEFEFKVEAYVAGKKSGTAVTTVLITVDNTPVSFSFPSSMYHGYIEENIYGDVNVTLRPIGYDQFSDEPLVYEIVEILPEFFPVRFGIDQNGVVFVRYPLDREDVQMYYITVDASQGDNRDRTMLVVHVTDQNDNPPYFLYDQLRMTVYENVNLTYAGNTFVRAYDDDVGENAEIRYEILSGSLGLIYIDPKRGQLYNYVDLDYEKLRRIKLVVAAYSGELSTTCKVFIYLRDLNDNPPVINDFEMFYNGHPNTLGGAEVAKVPVRDVDTTGILRFGILVDESGHSGRSSDQNIIQVDSTTGMIRINPLIQNTEDVDIHTELGIYVFDGVHASSARCKLTITGVTTQMVENSVSAHILNTTEDKFLRADGLNSLRNTTKDILGASSVTIFNIEEFFANDSHMLNVSFSARKSNGDFFTPVEILNTMYFQKDTIDTMCGFHISPAEEDTCVAEMCNKRQKCVTRKRLRETQTTYETNVGDVLLRFFGIPPLIEHWCECRETKTNGKCTETSLCDSQPCLNKGMCYEDENGGYGCICLKDYTGENCETSIVTQQCFPGACGPDEECENLPTGSFHCVCRRTSGCSNKHTWYFPQGAYLALPSLSRKSTMKISLQFSTYSSSGLLLYLGRYSFMYDFLALEIIRSEVSLTFNAGKFIMRVKVGTPGGVSDGRWHTVELTYYEKVVQVMLDGCKQGDMEQSNYPCAAYATQALDVTRWFLDVNTPFIMGSLPVQDGDSRIINNDFEGCIKDVYINNRLYSSDDTIRNKNTEPGCPWYKQRPDLHVNDDTFS